MRLTIENPKILADIVGIISELVTEVRLKITKEGVSVTAIDPANVAMTYFRMPAELFSVYELESDYKLGVNLENLKAVLRRCKPGSSLTISLDDNILKLEIKDRAKRDFGLALIDIEGEEKELPEWEFNSVIKMDANTFVEIIEDCAVVADACTFISEPNKFVVEASGLNSARAEFTADEVEIHSGNSKARFSLEYLAKFMKGSKISARAILSF